MRGLPANAAAAAAAALLTWVACLSSGGVSAVDTTTNYLVPYEETQESFVEWPTDSASLTFLQTRPEGGIPPVKLTLWTTAIDFRHPLIHFVLSIVRRLDKELLVFQPRHLLTDGLTNGCRFVDSATQEEREALDNNSNCQQNCTNHGRYCAASVPEDPILAAKISGASIVEESLRRACIWVIYGKVGGNSALNYFRYINDLLFEQCDDPFGEQCTDSIMDNSQVGTSFVEECMNHSRGVEADDLNRYLGEQLSDNKLDLTIDNMPALEIGHNVYAEEESTEAIFDTVCAAYPVGNQPMACEFCMGCSNVRYCLWFLECDGKSFEQHAAEKLQMGYVPEMGSDEVVPESEQDNNVANPALTIPPETTQNPTNAEPATTSPISAAPESVSHVSTASPTATPATLKPSNTDADEDAAQDENENDVIPNNDNNNNEEARNEAKEALIHGVLIGIAFGFVVSAMYGCRDWQARLILREFILEEGIKASHGALDGTFGTINSYFQNSFTPSEGNNNNDNTGRIEPNSERSTQTKSGNWA